MNKNSLYTDRQINRIAAGRAKEELRRRNEEFAKAHSGSSDAELLEYVRREAERLGSTPNAGDIIGGAYISTRFGGWKKAVAATELPPPKRQKPISGRRIFREECKRQIEILVQELRARESTTEGQE